MLYKLIFWSLLLLLALLVTWTVLTICEVHLIDAIAYQSNTAYSATYKEYKLSYLHKLNSEGVISAEQLQAFVSEVNSTQYSDIARSCQQPSVNDIINFVQESRTAQERFGYLDKFADQANYLFYLYTSLLRLRLFQLLISVLASIPFFVCLLTDYTLNKAIRDNFIYFVPKLQKIVLVSTTWYIAAFNAFTLLSPFRINSWLYYLSLIGLLYLLYRVALLIADRKRLQMIQ